MKNLDESTGIRRKSKTKVWSIISFLIILSNFLMAQNDIQGVWEFSSRTGNKQVSPDQAHEFSFWMEFTDQNVMMSNSNNREIADQIGVVSWGIGEWSQSEDTIFIKIVDVGNYSTNTGLPVKISGKTLEEKLAEEGINNIRFVITAKDDKSVTLKALDKFMFSLGIYQQIHAPPAIYLRPIENFGIETDTIFQLKKSQQIPFCGPARR